MAAETLPETSEVLSYSRNGQPLPRVDEIDIADAVSHREGLYRDAVSKGNAEQILPRLHHVNSRWCGRCRSFGGNGQPLADVDEVGVDDSVGGGEGLMTHSIMQRDAEQILPRLHHVSSLT